MSSTGKSFGVIGSGRKPPIHPGNKAAVIRQEVGSMPAFQYGMNPIEALPIQEKRISLFHQMSYEEQMKAYYTPYGYAFMKQRMHLPPSNLVLNLEKMAAELEAKGLKPFLT